MRSEFVSTEGMHEKVPGRGWPYYYDAQRDEETVSMKFESGEDIIYAVTDNIDSDFIMFIQGIGDFRLGADLVDAGHQHGIHQ